MTEDYNDKNKELKDKPDNRHYWKPVSLFLFILFGFIILLIRLFNLQILNADKYREISRHQYESPITMKAERGDIFDRNGELLASTIHSISFAVDPTKLKDEKDKHRICQVLENALGIPYDKTLDRINSAKGKFVWLIRTLLPAEGAKLDSLNLKAFLKIEEPKRNYLYGQTASQLIGCTDIDNKGLTGIEYKLDSLLKGNKRVTIMIRDALGRLMPSSSYIDNPLIHGKNVRLTVDIRLQKIVEYELAQGIEKSGSASGTVVAINPKNGEILAMATLPSFNPNDITTIAQGSTKSRAITDVYEPGSTFKLITAAAAIEEKGLKPTTVFGGYTGSLQFQDFQIKDEHPLGRATFEEAMEKSSNVIFSNIANSMPTARFYKYIRDFGFGLTSGIDLPGEVAGIIKKPAEMEGIYKRFIGFGYSIAVTPLQMLLAYSSIANNGIMMKPHIIKSIYDNEDNEIYKAQTEKIRQVVSKETAQMLTQMLINVVEKGTGTEARIEGVDIAGKTGTTQQYSSGIYSKSMYYASFAAYFPAWNPEIAMIIVLDKPTGNYYGGSTAAPIFNSIAKSWISMNPDLIKEGETNAHQKVVLPDLTAMRYKEALSLLNSLNLISNAQYGDYDFVTNQQPAPGTLLQKGALVTLQANRTKSFTGQKQYYVGDKHLRDAVSVLHSYGVNLKIEGKGRVAEQTFVKDSNGKTYLKLICK